MEIGTEISQKIRSAIKAKLIEQGAYVDDELPDYIMVMVANKKSQKQMTDDLSLFLGTNTDTFTLWLHHLLKKLQSLNTDEPVGQKAKEKDKQKTEKKKHKTSHLEKDKSVVKTTAITEKTKKTPAPENEKIEDKELEKKVDIKLKTKLLEEELKAEINISENTDEFAEEFKELENIEKKKDTSSMKLSASKVLKNDIPIDTKAALTTSSNRENKQLFKQRASSSVKHKDESKVSIKKPTSIVSSIKRKYEEEDEEEYDPLNPSVGKMASVVQGPTRKSSIPKSLQANKSLLMKAVSEAEKSISLNKKPEIRKDSSKWSMRSDEMMVDLKHRLKTPAGLKLISKSKRKEQESLWMSKESSEYMSKSSDIHKKARLASEHFENLRYTVKNEVAERKSPPKKASPKLKAPPVAPSRVAASAFCQMGQTPKSVIKKEVKESVNDVNGDQRNNRQNSKQVLKELTESDNEDVDEAVNQYGPVLPDQRLVQHLTPADKDHIKELSTRIDVVEPEVNSSSDNVADPEIQQILDEADDTTLDINDDIKYVEENTRHVRDVSSPKEPRFIVTLDGVDPSTYSRIPEARSNLVQFVKPVQKQPPVVEQINPTAPSESTTEPAYSKMAPPKIKPFNINLKDTDDEDEPEEMDTEAEQSKTPVVNERCRFWPACGNSNACHYVHPSVPCRTFPFCIFGDKCLYIHPNCKFDSSCTRMDCPYTHATRRSAFTPTVIHKIVQVPMPSFIPPASYAGVTKSNASQCKFFPNCRSMVCPFSHPKPCRYGIGCMTKSTCTFYHPPLPGKDKLKWSAVGTKVTTGKEKTEDASQ